MRDRMLSCRSQCMSFHFVTTAAVVRSLDSIQDGYRPGFVAISRLPTKAFWFRVQRPVHQGESKNLAFCDVLVLHRVKPARVGVIPKRALAKTFCVVACIPFIPNTILRRNLALHTRLCEKPSTRPGGECFLPLGAVTR